MISDFQQIEAVNKPQVLLNFKKGLLIFSGHGKKFSFTPRGTQKAEQVLRKINAS